jgi:hypothetical protein
MPTGAFILSTSSSHTGDTSFHSEVFVRGPRALSGVRQLASLWWIRRARREAAGCTLSADAGDRQVHGLNRYDPLPERFVNSPDPNCAHKGLAGKSSS